MSDAITILNGGEAPEAAKPSVNASGADQAGLMQLNGGQAPGPASTGQGEALSVAARLSGATAEEPPLGGGVHAS